MINISVTEKQQLLKCPKQHYWGFDEKLLPKAVSVDTPLTIGTLGHLAVKDYNKQDTDIEFGMVLQKYNNKYGLVSMNVLADLTQILTGYAMRWSHEDKGIERISIEKRYTTNIPDTDVILNASPDLVYRKNGKIYLRDTKFLRQFEDDELISVNDQLINYLWVLAQNKIKVDFYEYDQIIKKIPSTPVLNADGKTLNKKIATTYEKALDFIRTLGLSEELNKEYLNKLKFKPNSFFRRKVFKVHDHLLNEQFLSELQSQAHMIENIGEKFMRLDYTCPRMCPYFHLCVATRNGVNVDTTKKVHYKKVESVKFRYD